MRYYAATLYMVFAFLLEGCVPNAVSYYRPTVDGGRILKSHCVPTESTVEFNLPDADGRLNVKVRANKGKQASQIILFFSGINWREIQFKSTKFRVFDTEKHLELKGLSILAYKSGRYSNLTTETYLAPLERHGLFRFQVEIRLSGPLPSKFELLSPSIVVDGEDMVFPEIRFEKKLWMGISPFNC